MVVSVMMPMIRGSIACCYLLDEEEPLEWELLEECDPLL